MAGSVLDLGKIVKLIGGPRIEGLGSPLINAKV